MIVDSNLIIEIKDLYISEDLGRGDKITEDIFITNNKTIINKIINPIDLELQKAIGLIDFNSIINSSVYIYRNFKFDTDEYDPLDLLNEYISYIHGLSDVFWLIRDNSVNLGNGYLLFIADDNLNVSRNKFYILKSTSDSIVKTTNFSRSELRIVRSIFQKYTRDSESNTRQYLNIYDKRNSRMSRLFYLIHLTRSTKNIATKIVNYASCFETLFSTTNFEVAHQIAERVAFLLEAAGNKRRTVYQDLKKAYNFRSRIIHGGSLKENELSELESLIIKIDKNLRTVVNLIISDFESYKEILSNSESIDEYFHNMIFCGNK